MTHYSFFTRHCFSDDKLPRVNGKKSPVILNCLFKVKTKSYNYHKLVYDFKPQQLTNDTP